MTDYLEIFIWQRQGSPTEIGAWSVSRTSPDSPNTPSFSFHRLSWAFPQHEVGDVLGTVHEYRKLGADLIKLLQSNE
jgi:hypothetical protein